MNQTVAASFDNYTRAGDVATIAIGLVMFVLLFTSYVSKTRSCRIFINIVWVLIVAAVISISYHELLRLNDPGKYRLVSVLRIIYQALLFDVFFLFALYAVEVTGLEHRIARIVAVSFTVLLVAFVGIDVVREINGSGYSIQEDGSIVFFNNVFLTGYIVFFVLLVLLLSKVRHLLYRRVMYGFYGTMAVALAVRMMEIFTKQTSLITMSFLFPVVGMLYIMHSNPYNISLGSVDVRSMEDFIRNMHSRGTPFVFLSLQLPEFDGEGKELPEEISAQVRRFTSEFFRNCYLFQIGNGHVVLMFSKQRNADYEHRIQLILSAFYEQYRGMQHPYKIVIGESMEEISRKNEYVSLIRSINEKIPENTVHRVTPDDIADFNKAEYILGELTDIHNKRNVNDPRVLAYCQPVFNIRTGQFDTAEALMRLKLEETGMVYPDQFIPMAEAHGYIHVLTEIILHKTCRELHRLREEGFRISRISVNVSVLELKDESFCDDINRIIQRNGVPGDQVAIELTESRNEDDFELMKDKISELREEGIRFYLDDFGTGYSNMERIMELPFDIIKFDRSLVIASGTDERSGKIVDNLARMFREMDYSVLYEGVEDDKDEKRCREMSATYLQGYKYSRPIPIEKLRDFLPSA